MHRCLCLLLLGLVLACASQQTNWRQLARDELDPQRRHTLVFAARQAEQGLRALETVVLGSRGFLSRQQVAALTAHAEASQAIESFLRSKGVSIDRRSRFGEYIHASATIAQWEELLRASFFPYSDGKSRIHRASSFTVPRELERNVGHVLYATEMTPRNKLKPAKRRPAKRSLRSLTPAAVTPSLLDQIYNITSTACDDRATQAVYAALGQNFSPTDVSAFLARQGFKDEVVVNVQGGHHNGTLCTEDADMCSEGNLDMEYMLSIW